MSLLDGMKKALDKTDLDEKIAAKTGFDLNDLDESKVEEIKKMAGDAAEKADIAGIAKKVGVSEDVVNKVLGMIK